MPAPCATPQPLLLEASKVSKKWVCFPQLMSRTPRCTMLLCQQHDPSLQPSKSAKHDTANVACYPPWADRDTIHARKTLKPHSCLSVQLCQSAQPSLPCSYVKSGNSDTTHVVCLSSGFHWNTIHANKGDAKSLTCVCLQLRQPLYLTPVKSANYDITCLPSGVSWGHHPCKQEKPSSLACVCLCSCVNQRHTEPGGLCD